MSTHLLAPNLLAWVFQLTLLLGVGLALPRLTRLRSPRARLLYWQGLLAVALLLPLAQPWVQKPAPATAGDGAAAILGGEIFVEGSGPAALSPAAVVLSVVAGGALLRLAWLLAGFRRLRAMRRAARPLASEPAAVAAVRRDLDSEAEILVSEAVSAPVTFGAWRPAVLLPVWFAGQSAAAQTSIICHELLHVRRRDGLAVLAEEAVRALLWFHPAVWLVLDRIALAREQVVDQQVVALTGARRAYLETLWSTAARDHRELAPVLPFLKRGHLRERVAHLAKENSMSRLRTLLTGTALGALLLVTALAGVATFPLTTAEASEAPGDVLDVEGDVQHPIKKHAPVPVYPPTAKEQRIEGIVILKTVIDNQGRVTDTEVLHAVSDDLADAAVEAVSRWEFEPAILDGKPVAVFYNLTINFRLAKDAPPENG